MSKRTNNNYGGKDANGKPIEPTVISAISDYIDELTEDAGQEIQVATQPVKGTSSPVNVDSGKNELEANVKAETKKTEKTKADKNSNRNTVKEKTPKKKASIASHTNFQSDDIIDDRMEIINTLYDKSAEKQKGVLTSNFNLPIGKLMKFLNVAADSAIEEKYDGVEKAIDECVKLMEKSKVGEVNAYVWGCNIEKAIYTILSCNDKEFREFMSSGLEKNRSLLIDVKSSLDNNKHSTIEIINEMIRIVSEKNRENRPKENGADRSTRAAIKNDIIKRVKSIRRNVIYKEIIKTFNDKLGCDIVGDIKNLMQNYLTSSSLFESKLRAMMENDDLREVVQYALGMSIGDIVNTLTASEPDTSVMYSNLAEFAKILINDIDPEKYESGETEDELSRVFSKARFAARTFLPTRKSRPATERLADALTIDIESDEAAVTTTDDELVRVGNSDVMDAILSL